MAATAASIFTLTPNRTRHTQWGLLSIYFLFSLSCFQEHGLVALLFQILPPQFVKELGELRAPAEATGLEGRTRPFTAFNFDAYFFIFGLEIGLVAFSTLTAFSWKKCPAHS